MSNGDPDNVAGAYYQPREMPSKIYIDYSGGPRGDQKVNAFENRWHDDLITYYHQPREKDMKDSLPEQNYTDDQKREMALRMAIQSSGANTPNAEVVEKANSFLAFLSA